MNPKVSTQNPNLNSTVSSNTMNEIGIKSFLISSITKEKSSSVHFNEFHFLIKQKEEILLVYGSQKMVVRVSCYPIPPRLSYKLDYFCTKYNAGKIM